MARRNRGQGSQGRAEGRVRGRVQERVRGRTKRGGGAGQKRSTFDLGAIEGYANRLAESSRSSRGTSGPGLAGVAPGLAGAASGLAGGSFASRFMEGGAQGSEEDFRKEVAEHFALIEERLLRLEELVLGAGEQGGTVDPAEPESEVSPDLDQ
jgi:hypothetical protein